MILRQALRSVTEVCLFALGSLCAAVVLIIALCSKWQLTGQSGAALCRAGG